MASNNALETRYTANIGQWEREIKRMQRLNNQLAGKLASDQARAAQRSAKAWNDNDPTKGLSRSIGRLKSELGSLAPMIAGAFSVGAVASAADVYTRYTNSLKVAGVEGANLKVVQDQLFKVAQANGVELETLGGLYGKAAQSAKELGASQQQLLQFTEGVALALRVQGGDAQSAQGALLQLGQALAGGTVRAEEFNSINEGALPILQAVAAGSDKFGGSVAKLRKEVNDGKVSSKEFFAAFLKGSTILEEKAASAAFTLSQSFTVLSNAFTKYVGEADQATGASAVLVGAVKSLANNLPEVANALAIIAGIYAASFIPGMARATAAIFANTAAMAGMGAVYSTTTRSVLLGATAMNTAGIAGRGLAAALGGPLGIALVAVTVAMGYWAVKTAEANAEANRLAGVADKNAAAFEKVKDATEKSAKEYGGLTNAQIIAMNASSGLIIKTDQLANAHYRAAAAARAQRIEEQKLAVAASGKALIGKYDDELGGSTPFNRNRQNLDATGKVAPIVNGKRFDDERKKAGQRVVKSKEYQTYKRDKAVLSEMEKEKDVFKFDPAGAPTANTPAGDKGKGKGKAGGAGKKASEGTDETRSLDIELLNLKLEQTTDLSARLQLQKEILGLETQGKLAAIEKQVKDGSLTKAAGDILVAKEQEAKTLRETKILDDNRKAVAEQALKLDSENVANRAEALRQEADEIAAISEYARTVKSKHDYEWQALQKRQEADKLEFDLQQKQYEADLKLLGLSEDKIRAMMAERAAIFEGKQTAQSNNLQRGQSKDDPSIKDQIVGMAEGFGTLNAQLGSIATGALNDLTKGMADAVMGAGSLKEAFGDMAKSIIRSLIEMAIKFVIFEAIGRALGVPGLGRAAIGMGGTPKGVAGNAMGTNSFAGGLSMVGEKGPELMYIPKGGQIAPNNLLRSALQGGMGGGSAPANIVNLTTVVNAQDAVLTSWVKQEIQQSQAQMMQVIPQHMNRGSQKKNRNTLFQ